MNERGDDCLALLLAGVELYAQVGREMELLDIMRKFARDAEEIRNTPTAAELRELYEREDPRRPPE